MSDPAVLAARASERLGQLVDWAFLELERTKYGWPAVVHGDAPGIWTTAQFVRSILIVSPENWRALISPVEWLIDQQTDDNGWPLISGEQPATASTAEVVRAIQLFRRHCNVEALNQKLDVSIAQAASWLVHAQITSTGGWGFELSKAEVGSERSTTTALAVNALAECASEKFALNIKAATGFLEAQRQTTGWPDRKGGTATDHATALVIVFFLF